MQYDVPVVRHRIADQGMVGDAKERGIRHL